MYRTVVDLLQGIQVALREAMPAGVADLDSFINAHLPALGKRSVVQAVEEDGYAAEASSLLLVPRSGH